MNSRTLFWSFLFLLPPAVAAVLSISLQREQAALRKGIAQMSGIMAQRHSNRDAAAEKVSQLDSQRDALKADLKRLTPGLSSWQRGMLAAQVLAAQLAAAHPAGKGSASAPPPIVEARAVEPFFRQLLGDPAYSAAVFTFVKQQTEARWGLLLATLNLDPSAEDKLVNLLTQRQMVYFDAAGIVGNSGPTTGAAMDPTAKAISQEIAATFGPQVAAQVQAANVTQRLTQGIDDVTTRLSYTSTPLQPAQSDELTGLLVQSFAGTRPQARWVFPDTVIEQAKSFLAPTQVNALQQLQEEQKAFVQNQAAQGFTPGVPLPY